MNHFPILHKKDFISATLFRLLYDSSKNAETKWLQDEKEFIQYENISYSEKCSMKHANNHDLINEEIRTLIESTGCFEKKYILQLNENKYNIYCEFNFKISL